MSYYKSCPHCTGGTVYSDDGMRTTCDVCSGRSVVPADVEIARLRTGVARLRDREARVRSLCAEQIAHAQSDFQASVYEDMLAILDEQEKQT